MSSIVEEEEQYNNTLKKPDSDLNKARLRRRVMKSLLTFNNYKRRRFRTFFALRLTRPTSSISLILTIIAEHFHFTSEIFKFLKKIKVLYTSP